MSVYFNLNLKKKKEDYHKSLDEIFVNVYYYFNKRKLNTSTGVSVKLKDWNENWSRTQSKDPIKNTDNLYKSKNLLIKNKVKEIEDIIHQIKFDNQIPSIDLVKSYLNQNEKERIVKSVKNIHFLYVLQEYLKWINSTENRSRDGYKKSIRTCVKRIEDFTFEYQKKRGYKLLITDIDNEYQYSLVDFLDKRKEQPSTIRKRLKILVNMINWCRDEKGFTNHSIKVVKIKWDFKRKVIYLERDEVLQLYRFNDFNCENYNHTKYTDEYITDYLKGSKTTVYTNLEVIKDMLVFGCGVGCRFSDLVSLKIGNYEFSKDRTEGWFVFRMKKSEMSKEVRVPSNNLTFLLWNKYSKNKSIDDYIFPRTKNGNPISNQKFNKHIKYIGEKVGLSRLVTYPKFNLEGQVVDGTDTPIPLFNHISSHIIRRTFIREGLDSGIPPRILMELSGHTTEKIFKRYFDTLPSEIDEEGRKMYSRDLTLLMIVNQK